MRILGILAAALTLLASATASATCFRDPVNDYNDKAQFLGAVTSSVVAFGKASDDGASLSSISTGTDFLTTMDAIVDDVQCASDIMAGFDKSSDQYVRLTARSLQATAAQLIQLSAATRQDFVKELNGDFQNEKAGDHAVRMSAMSTAYRKAWDQVPPVIDMALMASVEYESANSTKAARMSITRAQRAEINQKLVRQFPFLLKGYDGAKNKVDVAAGVIYESLNNRGFQMHDQPYVERKPG